MSDSVSKTISMVQNTDIYKCQRVHFRKGLSIHIFFSISAFYEGIIQNVNRGIFKAPLLIEMMGAVDEPKVNIRKGSNIITMLRLYHL